MNKLGGNPGCGANFGRYVPGMNESRLDESRLDQNRLEKIGSAAAGIAHDINNQLNLVVNHLSQSCPDSSDVDQARQAAQRCSALTSSLLSYCRTVSLVNQSLDPAKIARKFVSEFRVPAGIELELDIPHSLPLMRANGLAVSRALTNIANNACDAMNGHGTLRISASAQQLEISDSGPGIPGEQVRKIFEPFYSTKGGAGFGLGLSIVRELMREMGGYVAVSSEPGAGTHFILRFRAA
jgi:two-component system, NtrC family, sensor kinase